MLCIGGECGCDMVRFQLTLLCSLFFAVLCTRGGPNISKCQHSVGKKGEIMFGFMVRGKQREKGREGKGIGENR